MKSSEDNYKWVLRGISISMEHSVENLERITRFLSEQFSQFDGTELPEYQEAINAIRRYRDTVVEEFRKGLEIEEE